jgi:DNA adenine methylase
MYMASPLRYPGAKWKITSFVETLLKKNSLSDGQYVEPYAGGSSLALSLLYRHAVSEIHLNDLDRSVYAFWKSAVEQNREFIRRVQKTRLTIAEWRRQKQVLRERANADIFDLGFAMFFLNRTNRSGILRAGVIGGQKQTGRWKIDARFNRDELIHRLQRLGLHASQITITNLDALKLLKKIKPKLSAKSLVYLDPPYYVKGRDLYLNVYRPDDHAAVRDAVRDELQTPWMVSYDDVPQIRRLYRDVRSRRYFLNYSADTPRDGTEVLFFSDQLTIPRAIA